MHKYFLRLFIEEVKKVSSGGGAAHENGERNGEKEGGEEDKRHTVNHQMVARSIMSVEFPETTFVAVTAYQNESVSSSIYDVHYNYLCSYFRSHNSKSLIIHLQRHSVKIP